jgi:hypothetical protein
MPVPFREALLQINPYRTARSLESIRRELTLPITLKEFVDLKKSSSQDEVARFATNFGCLHYS